MFCEIFGGSPSSKLFRNVREKLSLCYYCSASGDALKGTMFVTSAIDNANLDRTRREIFAQLEEMRAGNITDEEMDSARRAILSGYRSLPDTGAGMAGWFLRRTMAGSDTQPEEVMENIRAVTKEDIVRAAQRVTPDTLYFLRGTRNEEGEDNHA